MMDHEDGYRTRPFHKFHAANEKTRKSDRWQEDTNYCSCLLDWTFRSRHSCREHLTGHSVAFEEMSRITCTWKIFIVAPALTSWSLIL